MTELKCKNCNSTDFEFKGGIWVCNSCGTKYIPDGETLPRKSKEDILAAEVWDTIKMAKDPDYASHLVENPAQLEKYILRLKTVTNQLEIIRSNNPYALTARARQIPLESLWTELGAEWFIHNIENALTQITKYDKGIWDILEEDFNTYKDWAIESNPTLEDEIIELEKKFEMGFLYS